MGLKSFVSKYSSVFSLSPPVTQKLFDLHETVTTKGQTLLGYAKQQHSFFIALPEQNATFQKGADKVLEGAVDYHTRWKDTLSKVEGGLSSGRMPPTPALNALKKVIDSQTEVRGVLMEQGEFVRQIRSDLDKATVRHPTSVPDFDQAALDEIASDPSYWPPQ